ncbi:MAG: F0F1 ATP synthase subunit A [Acidimicrobiales bacterium]
MTNALFGALEFPTLEHLIEWPGIFLKGTPFEVNKVVILMWLSVAVIIGVFTAAGKGKLIPTGLQSLIESGVEFVRNDIVLQVMGRDGLRFAPYLTTMFFFIMVLNFWEVVPGIQFPVNARMAVPALLALLSWAVFNWVGIKSQGFGGYVKGILIPPGVPKPLVPLVALIELVSTILVRPFSLAVRLFANSLAGHLLLVTFAVLSAALWTKGFQAVVLPLPFLMLTLLTGFEIFVALLQAFIFTILTAVYIAGAMHPEH